MSRSVPTCTLLLVSVAAVCIQLHGAHDVHVRCLCVQSVRFVKGTVWDFQVVDRRSGCDHTELVVTVNRHNSTDQVCVNTDGKMGRAFLRCWERINKEESRKMECIDKKRKAE